MPPLKNASCQKPFFYKEFPRYNQIQRYLREFQGRYPKQAKVETIGKSVNGHDIYMVKLSDNIESNTRRDIVLIDAAIHAREWLSLTTSLYFIENAVKHKPLLKIIDIFVIPCVNPDGYEYTHTVDRLWRKNLSTNCSEDPADFGVDLNRNFPFCFGGSGSSDIKSNGKYRGPGALSEPESRSLAAVFDKYTGYIKLYISLHAFGEMILFPFGFSRAEVHDVRDLINCGIAGQQAIFRKGNKRCFKVGNSCKLLYRVNGCSTDFARGAHHVNFSYIIELPKFGKSGFEPRPSKIEEVGRETYAGISAMIKFVYKYYAAKNKCSKGIFKLKNCQKGCCG